MASPVENSVEPWIWLPLAAVSTILRISIKLRDRDKLQRVQCDDYLILLALIFFTAQTAATFEVRRTLHNLNLATMIDARPAPPSDEKVNKLFIVIDQCRIASIWLVKACLLILYYRLTDRLRTHRVIFILAATYAAFGCIFVEVFKYGVWCRPFSRHIHEPTGQCLIPTHHWTTEAVFNISSDMLVILIVISMLIRTRFSLQEKIYFTAIFGLGIFVVAAAIAGKISSFTDPAALQWLDWYAREGSTAIMVANMPATSVLIREGARRASVGVRRSSAFVVGALRENRFSICLGLGSNLSKVETFTGAEARACGLTIVKTIDMELAEKSDEDVEYGLVRDEWDGMISKGAHVRTDSCVA